ncbi:hypothetical protein AOC36_04795 [Erysipelothrix larvae]|uniref:POTRA domain-containing protein n=1 Tax=Erysipelothrix larvae TaxID=1514105 RepID=A0A109UGW5_9FIRM|nr:hypothetical protein [Erysipelothrix larvae]AMC93315.1 hypothetical protein AOC36_04795 [Erysipelothrix larvae]
MSRRRVHEEQESHVEKVQKELLAKKKLARKRRRKRIMRRIMFILVFVLVISGIVYVDNQPFSRVSSVDVVGNNYINSDIILNESNVEIGDRLIFTLSHFVNRRISNIPGVALSETNVYYTKGKVVLNVKEKEVVAYLAEGPTVLFADNALYVTASNSYADFPLLVGFTNDIINAHPEFADKLSRIEKTAFYNISEIHYEVNEFETLYMRFVMNNGFKVFTSVENMMLMNHYTEIVSSVMNGDHPDNRCIYFLDYYEDVPDSQVSIAKPCGGNQ